MRILLIDDMRNESYPVIPEKVTLIARDYQTGIDALEKMGPWDLLLLDHDLASYGAGREWTGYDVMCFLEQRPELLPGRIEVVSDNPVGRKRIQMVIDKLYEEKENE